MEKPYPQNFANHARILTGFHRVALPLITLNLAWSLYRLNRAFSAGSVFTVVDALSGVALAAALILLFIYARNFALTVQDRVIRLEMMLRLNEFLPTDLRPRISEFTVDQLVALRFASDSELPELARRVLAESLRDRKTIKRLIQNWKPDFLRV